MLVDADSVSNSFITREIRTSGCKAPEIKPRVYLQYGYL